MPRKSARRKSALHKRKPPSVQAQIRQIRELLDARLELIQELQHTTKIQFQRIAQLQAELDELKRTWEKMSSIGR